MEQLETEIHEQKRYYRTSIREALNQLLAALVAAITEATNLMTSGGKAHAPEFMDELVDIYAIETQSFLTKEAENAEKLIEVIRHSAQSGENQAKPYIDQLERVVRNWDFVAQPIQLSAQAKGVDHELSVKMAYSVRSLAIDLFNTHDLLGQSQR